jgi:hypothetical protein
MGHARIWKRLFWILGGFLVSWLLIAMFFDPDLVDDADLALPDREIDPSQNPYPEIRDLAFSDEEKDESVRIDAMYQGKEPFDLEFLESLLKKHSATLERFDRYAAMHDWRNDTPPGEVLTDLSYLEIWLRCSNLKRAEALRHAAQGNSLAAFDSVFVMLDFVDRLQAAEGPLLDAVAANGIASRGHYGMIDLLDHHRFESEELERTAKRLEAMRSSPSHFGKVLRVEHRSVSEQLSGFSRYRGQVPLGIIETPSWIPRRLVFKVNRTREMYANQMRAAVRSVDRDFQTFEREVRSATSSDRFTQWSQALSGNALGNELLSIFHGGLIEVTKTDFERRTSLSLLQLRVAFERYRLRNGQWPGELDALVPNYLDEIPKDWMDGNRLRYNPEKRRIYSVGVDWIDSGGETGKPGQLRDSKELVIELEPTEPTPWPDFSKRVTQPSE